MICDILDNIMKRILFTISIVLLCCIAQMYAPIYGFATSNSWLVSTLRPLSGKDRLAKFQFYAVHNELDETKIGGVTYRHGVTVDIQMAYKCFPLETEVLRARFKDATTLEKQMRMFVRSYYIGVIVFSRYQHTIDASDNPFGKAHFFATIFAKLTMGLPLDKDEEMQRKSIGDWLNAIHRTSCAAFIGGMEARRGEELPQILRLYYSDLYSDALFNGVFQGTVTCTASGDSNLFNAATKRYSLHGLFNDFSGDLGGLPVPKFAEDTKLPLMVVAIESIPGIQALFLPTYLLAPLQCV